MNKNNLIAGFFRYHREKLNYSQRGLINDSSPVKESSLCDFENGKRMLNEEQLVYLFRQIGFDYFDVLNSYDFSNEYNHIITEILNGNINNAEALYLECVNKDVYNTLGTLLFSLIAYLLGILTNFNKIELNDCILKLRNHLDDDHVAILNICEAKMLINNGKFNEAIILYNNSLSLTFDNNLRSWIFLMLGNTYSKNGDYYNAQKHIENALSIYSQNLNFRKMIQANLYLSFLLNNYLN